MGLRRTQFLEGPNGSEPHNSRPWPDLPYGVVFEIIRRIPCAFDRIRVNAVCHSWRAALVQVPPPPALPGFILWKADGPTLSCIVADGGTHPVFVPDVFRRASHFGLWLSNAVAQSSSQALLNLNNLLVIDQPNQYTFDIVAATLSSPPNKQGCVVGGIVDILPMPNRGPICDDEVRNITLVIRHRYNQCVAARYLVESRGHLLMSPASAFRVVQMAKEMLNEYAWEELLTLDGRMLFVGRGCIELL
ncbi:hypothetical protein E2562_029215 [Oryza meyeriana var. granulata]|uniref:F-box domain-containing protein n=1 Tax=Oryza meyeriana var. granulata TaxID=110450 RepID=A0A6G1EQQ8_9ORYZ|nr:hypothetical protein E2562_029215 [Oryza meyeriana var. granulata]